MQLNQQKGQPLSFSLLFKHKTYMRYTSYTRPTLRASTFRPLGSWLRTLPKIALGLGFLRTLLFKLLVWLNIIVYCVCLFFVLILFYIYLCCIVGGTVTHFTMIIPCMILCDKQNLNLNLKIWPWALWFRITMFICHRHYHRWVNFCALLTK